MAERFLPGEAQCCPAPPQKAGHNQSSIPAGDVPLQGHIENIEAIVCQDNLLAQHVQVLLIALVVASSSGLRAIVDSVAAPVPAKLPAGNPVVAKLPVEDPVPAKLPVEDPVVAKLPVKDPVAGEVLEVAESVDSMVEDVSKGMCNVFMDVACPGCGN